MRTAKRKAQSRAQRAAKRTAREKRRRARKKKQQPASQEDFPFKVTVHCIDGPFEQALREFKERVYRGWLDEPDPALGYVSPRVAVESEPGRAEVVAMIRELEEVDRAQSAEGECYDFGVLRRELGLV